MSTTRISQNASPSGCLLKEEASSRVAIARVSRAGIKLGICLPSGLMRDLSQRINIVRISIENKRGKATFLASKRPWTTIPSAVVERLGVRKGEVLRIVECRCIRHRRVPSAVFSGSKVDMFSFVPKLSSGSHRYVVDRFTTELHEKWLRIWYYHRRGSARQLEIKRYVDPLRFGMLLGQIQAEGEKSPARLAFKNRSIREHENFVLSLRDLGVDKTQIKGRIVYNPDKTNSEELSRYACLYLKRSGIQIATMHCSRGMRGTIVLETYVRSKILAEIVLHAMSKIRKILSTSNSKRTSFLLLRKGFVSELLAGDGSIDIHRRGHKIDVRVKISDGNTLYLKDYRRILERLGFHSKLTRHRSVVFNASMRDLLTLFSLRAFGESHNWGKLLCAIGIALTGRQNRTYRRLERIRSTSILTSVDLKKADEISLEAARQWLGRMEKRGYLFRSRGFHGPRTPVGYALTQRGVELVTNIVESHEEIGKLKAEMSLTSLTQMLKVLAPRTNQTVQANLMRHC